MRGIAGFCLRRRRVIVAGWIGFLVVVIALSAAFSGEFSTEFKLPGSESQEALDLLEANGANERGGIQGQVVYRAEQGVQDPEVQDAIEGLLQDIEETVPNVQVVSPYEPGNEYQISEEGTIAYAELNFSDRSYEEYAYEATVIKGLRDEVSVEGLTVELGGDMFADAPTFSNEFIGIIAAVIILLVAFGSVIAMGLPILTALFGIGSGIAIIGLGTQVAPIPEFSTQLAAMIGLGVGIDYALLIVTRYRDALRDGMDPRDAVSLSLDTSGRAVLFAGLIVVIALLGMFLMDLDFVRAVSASAIVAVLLTMTAALTLLPALLGFAGRNIDRFGLPHRMEKPGEMSHSLWWRWSRVIQSYPWLSLILSASFLIMLTIPVLSMRLGFGDAGNRPETDTSRRAFDMLAEGFGPGFNAPILVVVESGETADQLQLAGLTAALADADGVVSVSAPIPVSETVTIINVFGEFSPQDVETTDLVHRLRNETIPPLESADFRVLTTGQSPGVVDFAATWRRGYRCLSARCCCCLSSC